MGDDWRMRNRWCPWLGYVFLISYHNVEYNNSAVVNVVLAFFMGNDIEAIVSNPIGQPMATLRKTPHPSLPILKDSQILFNSFGQRVTLAVWSIVVFVQ